MIKFNVSKLSNIEKGILLQIIGPIDVKTICTIEEKSLELIDQGYCYMVVDMEKVPYINSTGLGSYIKIADTISALEGELVFVHMAAKLRTIFNMLGLEGLIKFFDNVKEAKEYLQSVQKKPDNATKETKSKTSLLKKKDLAIVCPHCHEKISLRLHLRANVHKSILKVLQSKFQKISSTIKQQLLSVDNSEILDTLLEKAAIANSLEEFAVCLHKSISTE